MITPAHVSIIVFHCFLLLSTVKALVASSASSTLIGARASIEYVFSIVSGMQYVVITTTSELVLAAIDE